MAAADKELLFKVTVHNGAESRIDKHRGNTTSLIQKATANNFGHIVPYVAKVRTLRSYVILSCTMHMYITNCLRYVKELFLK